MNYKCIVIGTSAGGLEALKTILKRIDIPNVLPIVVVQHLSPQYESHLASILCEYTGHYVVEINEKELIKPGIVYIAPPNFHVLVEKDHTFTLTVEERVSYARPSIDVLFETASDAYGSQLIGVLLTGANHDGAKGIKAIRSLGGLCIIQDPDTAYAKEMPLFGIREVADAKVMSIEEIGDYLNRIKVE